MIQDEKYKVDIEKFMAELRRYLPGCRGCNCNKR
jgi:hypothetical protein